MESIHIKVREYKPRKGPDKLAPSRVESQTRTILENQRRHYRVIRQSHPFPEGWRIVRWRTRQDAPGPYPWIITPWPSKRFEPPFGARVRHWRRHGNTWFNAAAQARIKNRFAGATWRASDKWGGA